MAGVDDQPRPFKLPRPNQLEELTPDQLVAVIMRLAMEVSVLRDRLHTHEALLSQQGLLTSEAIDDYRPAADEAASRREARSRLIESLIDDLS